VPGPRVGPCKFLRGSTHCNFNSIGEKTAKMDCAGSTGPSSGFEILNLKSQFEYHGATLNSVAIILLNCN
jgi:hypothetical protein